MSEKMDGHEVVSTLNEYHSAMVEVLFEHGGTLDKFMGDGILAYFGARLPAGRSRRGRGEMCAGWCNDWSRSTHSGGLRDEPALKIGVGVHTGLVVVGDGGPEQRREYTVIGDAVNLASRIEGLTKEHGAAVLVSEATRAVAGEGWDYIEAPAVAVKGRSEPVTTFVPSFAIARGPGGSRTNRPTPRPT